MFSLDTASDHDLRIQDYRITGKMPRPPRCVTGVEVVENVDVYGVGVV